MNKIGSEVRVVIAMLVGLLCISIPAYADEQADWFLRVDPDFTGYTTEVMVDQAVIDFPDGLTGLYVTKQGSTAIDKAGNLYVVEFDQTRNADAIYIHQKDVMYSYVPFATATAGFYIKGIAFDNYGNMYCILNDVIDFTTDPYVWARTIIKIGGFGKRTGKPTK